MLQPVFHKNRAKQSPAIKPNPALAAADVEVLQKQIANAFNLFLNYKHYHWETDQKPLLRDLHIIFDEFASEVHSAVEELSARVRAIGENRVRVREFSKNAIVPPAKEKADARRMIEEADANVLNVIKEAREDLGKVAIIDPVSAKALRRFLVMNEKHEWWLRHILEKRQGLSPST